jgi:WD40 repeat protein
MAADFKQAHIARDFAADSPLVACRFDPKGRFVFCGGEDRSICRFDLATGKKTVLAGHDSWVMALALTPDGETLISGAGDDSLIWWQAAADAPQLVRKVKAHAGWIRAVAVSPDGALVASAGNDRVVRLWKTADGSPVREMSGHEKDVYALLWHPSGAWVLSGDLMGVVMQWDAATGAKVWQFDASPLHTYEGGQQVHYGGIRGLTLSPDGKSLASGGLHKATNPLGNVQEPIVIRCDWESAKPVKTQLADGLANHTLWGLQFHPDGFLAGCAGGNSGHLLFWNAEAEKPAHKFDLPDTARGMDIAPDGLHIATVHFDKKIRLTKLAPKG